MTQLPFEEGGVEYYPIKHERGPHVRGPMCAGCDFSVQGNPRMTSGSMCFRLSCQTNIWQSGDGVYLKWAAERLEK